MHFLAHPQSDSEPLETTFELSDTLFAQAKIPPTNEVYLWLGVSYIAESRPLSVIVGDVHG